VRNDKQTNHRPALRGRRLGLHGWGGGGYMNDWQSARTRACGFINIDEHTASLRPFLAVCVAITLACVGALALELL